MSNDIKLLWSVPAMDGDLEYSTGDLTLDKGLESAVIISMYTDARAGDDDKLDDPDDKRGWWGDLTNEYDDDRIGSKLWLRARSKTTNETLVLAKKDVKDCLQWMLDDGVAVRIDVNAERLARNDGVVDVLGIELKILQRDGNVLAMNFYELWEEQFNGL